jgi:hypothetical protein
VASFGTLRQHWRGRAREEKYKTMWVATLMLLLLLLAALGYLAFAARRLDTRLNAMLQQQSDERSCIQRELERLRPTTSPDC